MSKHSVKSLQGCGGYGYLVNNGDTVDGIRATSGLSLAILVMMLSSFSLPAHAENATIGEMDIKEIFSKVANSHINYASYSTKDIHPRRYASDHATQPTHYAPWVSDSNKSTQAVISAVNRHPNKQRLIQQPSVRQPQQQVSPHVNQGQLASSDKQTIDGYQVHSSPSTIPNVVEEDSSNRYVPSDYANINVNQHELAIMHVLSKVCPKLLNSSQNASFDKAFNKKLHDLLPNVKHPKSAMKYLSTQQDYQQLLSSMETWTLSFPNSENQELCEDIVNYQY